MPLVPEGGIEPPLGFEPDGILSREADSRPDAGTGASPCETAVIRPSSETGSDAFQHENTSGTGRIRAGLEEGEDRDSDGDSWGLGEIGEG